MMPILSGVEAEKKGLEEAAKLMLVSARTAPKSGGVDDVETLLVTGEEKDALAAEMDKVSEERRTEGFKRDGRNTRESQAIVLVGVRGTRNFGLNCGACGYATCQEFDAAEKKKGRAAAATAGSTDAARAFGAPQARPRLGAPAGASSNGQSAVIICAP